MDTFFRGKVEMIGVRVREEDPIVGHPPVRPVRPGQHPVHPLLRRRAERGRSSSPTAASCPGPVTSCSSPAPPRTCPSTCAGLGRDLPKVQSAFLIGGDRIAHYLSKMLLSMGVRVTLVENDEEHCRRLSEWLPGALVLYGTAPTRSR